MVTHAVLLDHRSSPCMCLVHKCDRIPDRYARIACRVWITIHAHPFPFTPCIAYSPDTPCRRFPEMLGSSLEHGSYDDHFSRTLFLSSRLAVEELKDNGGTENRAQEGRA